MKPEDREQAEWFAILEMQRQKDRAAMFDELVERLREVTRELKETVEAAHPLRATYQSEQIKYLSDISVVNAALETLAKAEKLK